MEGIVRPGARVWITPADSPTRKLRYTWSMIEWDGIKIGADTSLPNRLVKAMFEARVLHGFRSYNSLTPEYVHAPGSRVDFQLITRGKEHHVEVKNCHLVYPDGCGYFPDSVSERATKHLEILTREAKRGIGATVLFVVQRGDVTCVRPSDAHDPVFGKAARKAAKAGVRFRALKVEPRLDGLYVLGEVPVDLQPYDMTSIATWRSQGRLFSGWQRIAKTHKA
jgi:sugar fermentation stimulation protein A